MKHEKNIKLKLMLLDIICNFSHRIVERNRNISVSVNDTCCFILFLTRLEFRDFVYAKCSFPDCPKELLCCSRGRKEVILSHGIATVEPRNGTVAIADISLVHFYGYCRHPRTNCSFETLFFTFLLWVLCKPSWQFFSQCYTSFTRVTVIRFVSVLIQSRTSWFEIHVI